MTKTIIAGREVRVSHEIVSMQDDRVKKMGFPINPNADLIPFIFERSITKMLDKMGVKLIKGTEFVHVTMDAPFSRTDAEELIELIISQAVAIQASRRNASKKRHPASTSKAVVEPASNVVAMRPSRKPTKPPVKRNPRKKS